MSSRLKPLDWVSPGASLSLLAEIGVALLTFPASVILNRALGAQARGVLALVSIVPLTVFALGSCQWDRLAAGLVTTGRADPKDVDGRSLYYAGLLSLVALPLGWGGVLAFERLQGPEKMLAAAYCLNFPLHFLAQAYLATAAASGRLWLHYAMRLAMQFVYLLSMLALAASGWVSVEAAVALYFLMNAVAVAVRLVSSPAAWPRRSTARPSVKPLRQGFVPFAVYSLSERVDVWALAFFGSTATLGLYAGARALAVPIGMVSSAIASSSAARVEWQRPEAVRRFAERMLGLMGGIAVALVTAASAWGEPAIVAVLGPTFAGASWMLPWVVLAVVGRAAAHHLQSALRYAGHQRSYLVLQTAGSAGECLMVPLMGLFWGPLGVLVALVASAALSSIAAGLALVPLAWRARMEPAEPL